MELVWKRGKANFKISRADLADFPLRTLRKGKKGGGGGGGLAVCGGRDQVSPAADFSSGSDCGAGGISFPVRG